MWSVFGTNGHLNPNFAHDEIDAKGFQISTIDSINHNR